VRAPRCRPRGKLRAGGEQLAGIQVQLRGLASVVESRPDWLRVSGRPLGSRTRSRFARAASSETLLARARPEVARDPAQTPWVRDGRSPRAVLRRAPRKLLAADARSGACSGSAGLVIR